MKKVLGIETSCDETAAAIVTEDKRILSNVVLSQQEHEEFGGVVPEIAARAHLLHIDTLVKQALDEAHLTLKDIDAVAATAGPGLIGGVMVGAMTAKAIAAVRGIPVIAVNHLEGHALTVRLVADVPFPYLLLLVSGGHCQLLIVEGVGQYTCLGTTRDDAAGECFDKSAKLLGLGYPGGPAVEKMALECADPAAALEKFPLPAPMTGKPGCDFSFSGLKTAVRQLGDVLPAVLDRRDAADICHSFQHSVGLIFADRTEHAIKDYLARAPETPTLVVAGGVAANKALRSALEALAKQYKMRFVAPPPKLCTDNGAMIAWAGMERFVRGLTDAADFPVRPRWPLEELKGISHD
ncbi:MAG: tRNA (adenosine(37)-N6)-threonylcarbamoyltransferase complex transferase subunit TsaD [Alphaproteobacteria bacterium]|nr:tRNA (adenosine(37)-N6)-threonylcarbamoyltransferase complex transferase subunit TsaD [Alphaproteobacteria bacterium]